jgi:alcohol dehydrogenase/propanol-preferring alcohol dehydrogenase
VLGIGGVGHLALQFSRACGYETVALTHSPGKHELARELGADLIASSGAELQEAGGADVILVTGNSMTAATEAMAGLRVGGRMVLAGIDVAGSFTLEPDGPFFAQDQRILGSTHNGLHQLAEALQLAASRKVVPMVEMFELDRCGEALARVAAGSVRFRAVLTP